MARDDFEDADQLRIGNDGIFMLTFFSKTRRIIFVLLMICTYLCSLIENV